MGKGGYGKGGNWNGWQGNQWHQAPYYRSNPKPGNQTALGGLTSQFKSVIDDVKGLGDMCKLGRALGGVVTKTPPLRGKALTNT